MKKRTAKKASTKTTRAKAPSKKRSLPLTVSKCVVCGTEVREVHCRLVCPVCGAMSDCSDP